MKILLRLNIKLFISVFMFCSLGCFKESWYDVKSDKRQAVPSTLTDLLALLDDATLFNVGCPSSAENASDAHYFINELAEALYDFERNSYTWSLDHPNAKVPDWLNEPKGAYRKVYTSNLILETLESIKVNNEIEREQYLNIKGQALFNRGKAFFELAQAYVPPYSQANKGLKYGLPLRLESDVTMNGIRSTIEETYSQIISDIKMSVELLPNLQHIKTRPSKVAAYALLARVSLSIENYAEANLYADLALSSQSVLIQYSHLQIDEFSNPFIGYNSEIIYYSCMGGAVYFGVTNVNIKEDLFELYDENDLRKRAFYTKDASTGLISYKGTYAGQGFNSFFNGLATDELYLIRAECNVRFGKMNEALSDINRLLQSRWNGVYTNIETTDAEELLEIILLERRKELVFRGVRWSDLRRLNRDSRFVQTFTRVVGGKTYTLEPNSYKYTLPIPDDIIQITGMEQNPGWE